MLRTLLALGAGLALTGGAAGCAADPDAGTNGVGRQTPEAIAAKSRAAALAARSVHLSGTVAGQGTLYHLDVRLTDGAGVGRVTGGGRDFEVLRVDGRLYLKGGAGFYDTTGTSREAAETLRDKYVVVSPDDPAYQGLEELTDRQALLGSVTDLAGPPRKDGYREVGDSRTVAVSGPGGGTLQVALQGTPYPVRVDRPAGGSLDLSEFGKTVKVTAPPPAQVVDLGAVPASVTGR